ncbi:IS701 family transposase [Streptomyces minutiscleroticus]|uniref:IS701 family transposase n=1 Tax=Streptomyces minutiscleroticus TaxID=68238 RepID=UPI00167F0E9C|nr:transposase [Streptomyces minutiscleroticus]
MDERFCDALFASLRRSDQRLRARHYLRGLLVTEGRKSIRNIAALMGGTAAEQSLHHFISSSTWEWLPMRAALADYVTRVSPPQAWVVRPLFIPKAGEHSVGVGRQFVPGWGQEANGQLAFGTWAATDGGSIPLQWRLRLPESWLMEKSRRRKAEIPDSAEAETLDECATATALSTLSLSGAPLRPIVLDTEAGDLHEVLRPFATSRAPVLVRVGERTRLVVADRAMPGYRAGSFPARSIMESVRALRRPVEWEDPTAGSRRRTTFAAAIRVQLPQQVSRAIPTALVGSQSDLLLIGEWHDDAKTPTALWCAASTTSSVSDLLRLSRLRLQVAQDERQVAEHVGVRDFEGRSFRGWHRHMTLASAAHAVSVLSPLIDTEWDYARHMSA